MKEIVKVDRTLVDERGKDIQKNDLLLVGRTGGTEEIGRFKGYENGMVILETIVTKEECRFRGSSARYVYVFNDTKSLDELDSKVILKELQANDK